MSGIKITPPRLRTKEAEGHRSATWLELFYDLAFVVAVSVLAGRLLQDVSFAGLVSYFGYFALVWWLWASHTYYADRYDTDDLVYRLLAACQMVAVVVMAASLSIGEANSTTAFAAGYAVSRILLLVMYWRAYRHVGETRALTKGYLIGFGLAAVVWTASAFVGEETRVVLWAVALTIDLATPWVMRIEQARVPLDVSHLPERFGLFTILVLGETISAVVMGLSHATWALSSTTTAALSIGIATALWWLYFDNASGSVVRRDPSVRRTWRPTVWIYTHLPLAAALVGCSVAMERAVADAGHGAMPAGDRWLLVGCTAAVLLCLAVIQLASSSFADFRARNVIITRLAGIPVLVLVGLFTSLEPQWVSAGVLGVCVAELVSDLTADPDVEVGA
jgi:low temperature requirement protein LtrA